MEIVLEKIDDLNGVLVANVTMADHRDQVYTVLKDYARRASIPGFRPGKVPVSLVKKMYGKGVVYEELNKSLSAKLTDYIKENSINLVGSPLAQPVDELDLDPDSDKSFTFRYEIGFAPVFSLNLSGTLSSPRYVVTVDDAILEKEIGHVRSRYGEMTNPEVAEEGDILYGKITELGPEGAEVEGGRSKMIALNPERIQSNELKASMVGKTAGDTLDVKTLDIFDDANEAKRFFETNVQGQEVEAISPEEMNRILGLTFRFEVKKINRMGKAELNQELFDKAFGEGAITSEEEFRDRVRKDLEGFFAEESLRLFRAHTMKEVVDLHNLALPESFLRKWLMSTQENVNEGNVDKTLSEYGRSLRWSLVVDEIMKLRPDLKVNENDLREAAKDKARRELLAYMPDSNEETVERFAEYYLKDEKAVERLFNEAIENRVFQYLMGEMKAVEKALSATEFMEEVKKF